MPHKARTGTQCICNADQSHAKRPTSPGLRGLPCLTQVCTSSVHREEQPEAAGSSSLMSSNACRAALRLAIRTGDLLGFRLLLLGLCHVLGEGGAVLLGANPCTKRKAKSLSLRACSVALDKSVRTYAEKDHAALRCLSHECAHCVLRASSAHTRGSSTITKACLCFTACACDGAVAWDMNRPHAPGPGLVC
jgi:hypothetical protein